MIRENLDLTAIREIYMPQKIPGIRYITNDTVSAEYAQPSYDSDEEICYMDVFVTLVESPASFYIQLIGEDYSVRYVLMTTYIIVYHLVG